MTLLMRDQLRPEDGHVHDSKDGNKDVEHAEVESLARVDGLGRGRHAAQNDRLPAVVGFVDIGVVEVSKTPSLWRKHLLVTEVASD